MKIHFTVPQLQHAYREVCGKLPLLTVKCELGTTHDWRNQSVTGDGKTSTSNWQCSGRRRHVCEGELVRTAARIFGNALGTAEED